MLAQVSVAGLCRVEADGVDCGDDLEPCSACQQSEGGLVFCDTLSALID